MGAAVAAGVLALSALGSAGSSQVQVSLRSRVIDLYHSTSVTVSGITTRGAEVRLLGATDRDGLAYEWAPYRWQRLRPARGTWTGLLRAPALPGVYQVQFRLGGHELLTSETWLLRVFPPGTAGRRSFATPAAAVQDFVGHLAGRQVLRALRPWPRARFDRRDPRLHRLFVIAYAPRGDTRGSSRSGLFVTTVRDGFQGRWRLLAATVQPYA